MMHELLLDRLDPLSLTGIGTAGLFLGGAVLAARIWRLLGKRRHRSGPMATISGFTAGLLLMATGTLIIAIGTVFATCQRFTREIPVTEITTQPVQNAVGQPVTRVRYHPLRGGRDRYFFVHGDQWMISGDIVKWKPWLNLLGLHTRYRLTRLQGRYLSIDAERSAPRSLFSLVDDPQSRDERHPLWRFLYRSGQKLPLVDTVYGNAAYQNLNTERCYQVFVGTSGFIIRESKKEKNRAASGRT